MSKQSHNLVQSAIRTSAQPVRSNEQEKIRELFREVEAPAKCWVDKLPVTCGPRYFQMLMSGERDIPFSMLPKLRAIGVEMLLEKQARINSLINDVFVASYGPAAQALLDKGGE